HPLAVGYDQATVVVNRAPVARAGPDRRVAPGDEVTFDGRGSYDLDGGTLTYRWEIDGGGTSERATLRRRFEQPGIYTARLTVDDGGGTLNAEARDELTIAVNHPPRARPGDDVMTCDAVVELDGAASVDADGDPLSYRWNFGDGTPEVSGMRGRHTFAGGGTFPVVLTVDDGSGLANSRDAAALTVTINEPPSADAGEDRTVCTGDPVLLSAAGSTDPENGLLKYRWDFGNGEAAEGLNPSTRYREGGVYRVTLTVTDDSGLPCNTAVDGLVLRVAESPVADAGEDRTVCANAAVRLDGSRSRDFTDGVVDSFWWDFGDGSTGGGAGPVHVYKQPGTYRVTLDVTGDPVGDCDNTGSDAIMLTVLEAPVAELSAPEATPVGVPVTFDAAASSGSGREITARQWDFGDGTMAAGPTVSHTFATHGKYPVTLTVSTDADGACRSATTHRFLVVNAPPRAGAGSDRLVGVAEPVTFSGAGSVDPDGEITAYRWDFGDGTTASGPQVRHRWQRSGRYPVTLSVIDDTELANREHSTTIEVTVNAAPQPVIDGPDRACEGEEVAWTAGASEDPDGEIIAFAWDFGDGEAAEGREVSHTYREPGRYQLELSVDDGTAVSNRRALATRTVTVNRPPTAAPLPERIVCPGDEVRFNGSAAVDPDGEIHAWRWDFGDGAQGRGAEVSHVYARPGRHQVTLEVDDGTGTTCAVARERATVVVNASPEPDAGGDRKTFVGGAHDAVFFDAGGSSDPDGDPLTYLWDFGDDTSAAGVQVRHTYPEPGSYTVRLIVRDGTGTACGEAVAELRVEAGGPTLPPSRAGLDSQSMCCGFRSLECYLGMMSCRFGVWSEHKTERDAVPGSTEVNLSGFAGFRL
ncbi:MAG: PKD domain-containing protein, partial [bacterium]|nr:PKD domain-containing protein [bacterium]